MSRGRGGGRAASRVWHGGGMPADAPTSPLAAAHRAAREGVALIERPEVGKLAITGLDTIPFVQAHVTVDVATILDGAGRMGALLTAKGALLGTLRILRAGDALLLDCERPALQGIYVALHRGRVGWQIDLGKRTLQETQISLVGPGAAAAAGLDDGAAEHDHRLVAVGGVEARAIRTPDGVDLRLPVEDAPAVVRALVAGGAVPGDEALWEVLRVEAGRAGYGSELDERTLPADAGLVPDVVALDKALYPGMQTVLRQDRSGTVHRTLRGLRSATPLIAGEPVRDAAGAELGTVGTAVLSPVHGPLALALLRRSAEPGVEVTAGETAAIVAALPWTF
ncbi:folate-binding protein [Patulibacter sp. NPDC049589]|uniref:folate-binding protein n=1 Tax=Patulibacter sp. NPDC049589 TaxID=3154731 RepID=UPI0034384888